MKERVLMKGNEAIAEAAVRGGCRFFAGYPITPQNEIPEYLSKRLPEVGGSFIQSESEVSAINMIYGASCAGARAMTSSSSPGISLKQEGLSYIACGQLPCVVINMVRGGPGLGTIYPGQADYFQAVKGGGHGDYKLFVYTPATVQEAVDITYKSFEMADKYRIPVLILGDGTIGQMMEPVVLPEMKDPATFPEKKWALTGCKGRERNIINTLDMNPERLEAITDRLFDVYEQIRENETEYENYMCDDAETVIVAYGIVSRVAKSAVNILREQGKKVGLFRPITVSPYPDKALSAIADLPNVKKFLVAELSIELLRGNQLHLFRGDMTSQTHGIDQTLLVQTGGKLFGGDALLNMLQLKTHTVLFGLSIIPGHGNTEANSNIHPLVLPRGLR